MDPVVPETESYEAELEGERAIAILSFGEERRVMSILLNGTSVEMAKLTSDTSDRERQLHRGKPWYAYVVVGNQVSTKFAAQYLTRSQETKG